MNELQVFQYEDMPVRVIEQDGEPWWVLADVCRVLQLTTPAKVADRLDEDEKGMSLVHTLGGNQNMTIINESGLYKVILRSDKPEAKKFTRWVTHEVLPTIRRTGAYMTPQAKQRDFTKDDYLRAASIVSGCKNERLPYVLNFLEQAGFSVPEIQKPDTPKDDVDLVALLNQYTLDELYEKLSICRTSLYYYRKGIHDPQPKRRRFIIEALT